MTVYTGLYFILASPFEGGPIKRILRIAPFLFSLFSGVIGLFMCIDELIYSNSGIIAQAQVKDKYVQIVSDLTQRPQMQYSVRYVFNDANNTKYEATTIVDKYTWDMSELDPDRRLKISYIGDNPSESRLYEDSSYGQALTLLIVGFFGMLYLFLKNYYLDKMVFSVSKSSELYKEIHYLDSYNKKPRIPVTDIYKDI
jgi:hypothetical protein